MAKCSKQIVEATRVRSLQSKLLTSQNSIRSNILGLSMKPAFSKKSVIQIS